MIFAIGREINVVTFKTKNNDFDNKTFKNEGWNLYALSTSRLEKGPFSWGKSWKKGLFIKKRLEFYICHRWTPCIYTSLQSPLVQNYAFLLNTGVRPLFEKMFL